MYNINRYRLNITLWYLRVVQWTVLGIIWFLIYLKIIQVKTALKVGLLLRKSLLHDFLVNVTLDICEVNLDILINVQICAFSHYIDFLLLLWFRFIINLCKLSALNRSKFHVTLAVMCDKKWHVTFKTAVSVLLSWYALLNCFIYTFQCNIII